MPQTENPATQIESALANGNFGLALRIADKLVATSKRSLLGWISRARSNLGLGRICDADEDLDVAIRLAPDDAQANLLRGMVDQRLGRIDRAVDRLRKLAASKSPYAIEASVMFAETLYFSHRRDEFKKFVEAGGAWTNDARGPLMTARVRAVADPSGALEDLLAITRGTSSVVLRRVAGFDAVQMLDKMARYREAFDLAAHLHSTTTPPFDVDGLLDTVRTQRELLKQGRAWCAPRVESVAGVAMVVGLPRCGTTLLEQMLDGHSKISGIGEYDGVETWGQGLSRLEYQCEISACCHAKRAKRCRVRISAVRCDFAEMVRSGSLIKIYARGNGCQSLRRFFQAQSVFMSLVIQETWRSALFFHSSIQSPMVGLARSIHCAV